MAKSSKKAAGKVAKKAAKKAVVKKAAKKVVKKAAKKAVKKQAAKAPVKKAQPKGKTFLVIYRTHRRNGPNSRYAAGTTGCRHGPVAGLGR